MSNIFDNIMKMKKEKNNKSSLHQIIKDYENKINDYEKKMILNIVELSEIYVREIMVPRVDVISIDINSNIDEILKIVTENGISRLPVYNENIDNIIGILHVKDLLNYVKKRDNFNLLEIIRTPYFIPEYKTINELLIELREKRIHLAIVVDEYGGMAGIVCLEDIIERIVGEIQDEFDDESEDIIRIDENKYIINARISINDLNDKLSLNIDTEKTDSLSGFLYMLFGKIPSINEKIEYENCIFTIESIVKRKIKRVLLEIKKV